MSDAVKKKPSFWDWFTTSVGPADARFASKVLENGIVEVGTPEYRACCAYHKDGYALVEKSQVFAQAITQEIAELTARGILAEDMTLREASFKEIEDAYNSRAIATAVDADKEIQNKIYEILDLARSLRASDVKLIVRSHSVELRIYAAGEEHGFDCPLQTVTAGNGAINFLFEMRDTLSGQIGDQDTEFQSFAITSSDRFRLPPGISKLRCAKGFHGVSGGSTSRHLVMRLFYETSNKETATLDDLGLDEDIHDALRYMRYRDAGALIIGGSTGQGKNTTLVRAIEKLHEHRSARISIVSVESPIEIPIELQGVIQIPVSSVKDGEARNEAYVSALRHFKRIHPDVGLVSEITDKEGAQQTVEFVSSGHVCYTTVHALSAIEVPFELISKGIEPSSIARPNFLGVAMSQILIKALCPGCALAATKEDFEAPLCQAQNIDFSSVRVRNPEGCEQCSPNDDKQTNIWSGYARVMAVAEAVIPDDKIRKCISQNDPTGAYEHWRLPKEKGGLGGRRVSDKLVDLVNAGRVDPRDAMNRGMIVALELP